MLIFYVLGFPLIVLQQLCAVKEEFSKPFHEMSKDVILKFHFLFKGYEAEWFYWEIMVTLRKIAIVFIAVYFGYDFRIQSLLAILLCVVCVTGHAFACPFQDQSLDRLEATSLGGSFMTYFLGQFLFAPTMTEGGKLMISLVIFFSNFVVFVLIGSAIVNEVHNSAMGALKGRVQRAQVPFQNKGVLMNAGWQEAQELMGTMDENLIFGTKVAQVGLTISYTKASCGGGKKAVYKTKEALVGIILTNKAFYMIKAAGVKKEDYSKIKRRVPYANLWGLTVGQGRGSLKHDFILHTVEGEDWWLGSNKRNFIVRTIHHQAELEENELEIFKSKHLKTCVIVGHLGGYDLAQRRQHILQGGGIKWDIAEMELDYAAEVERLREQVHSLRGQVNERYSFISENSPRQFVSRRGSIVGRKK